MVTSDNYKHTYGHIYTYNYELKIYLLMDITHVSSNIF